LLGYKRYAEWRFKFFAISAPVAGALLGWQPAGHPADADELVLSDEGSLGDDFFDFVDDPFFFGGDDVDDDCRQAESYWFDPVAPNLGRLWQDARDRIDDFLRVRRSILGEQLQPNDV